jgi:glycosyltransferase involved in cell wall biosynthesis
MRIGFLAMKAGTSAGGLATYERYLVEALAQVDTENEYHVFCVTPVEPESFSIRAPNFTFHRISPRSRMLSMVWSAPRAIAKSGVDLLHAPFLPLLRSPVPFVFTAHGSEMFLDPSFFPAHIRAQLIPLTKLGYRRSAEIVCVSATTRDYVVEHFPETRGKARVVYNGCEAVYKERDPVAARACVAKKFGVTEPYVLAVGRVEPRKNPIRLLEAFARFRDRTGDTVRLVIAGNSTWSDGEARDTIARLNLAPRVTLLGHVDYEELPSLYAGAEMFVFPSLWEGFGLPIIEAMRCGAPVITSSISCMPEVAGGAALLVDPYSVDEIAAAMVRMHNEPDLRQRLRALGLVRGAEFSWERCARETIAAYRDVWHRTRARR